MENIISESGYSNVKLLSEGGHGRCYFAVLNGKSHILKVYLHDSESQAKKEAKVIKALHTDADGSPDKGDPHFFKGTEKTLSNGETCLESDTFNGQTLSEMGKLSVTEATKLMILSCDSIKKMHEKGYLHFDIKPDNLYKLDGVDSVILLDFGSSEKAQEKAFEDIMESCGYCTTNGFATKRLLEIKRMIDSVADRYPTEEEKNELKSLVAGLSCADDMFAAVCTYWSLLTNTRFDIESDRFAPAKVKIKRTLEKSGVPHYLLDKLTELFEGLLAPKRDARAKVDKTMDEFIEFLQEVCDIDENKGYHPEVLLRNSIEKHEKFYSDRFIDENLLTELEEIKNQNINEG